MARENLLDEGRAGTRHADHEDRLGRAMTATAHALHELGRERRFQSGEEARSRQLVINDVRALQRVARRELTVIQQCRHDRERGGQEQPLAPADDRGGGAERDE